MSDATIASFLSASVRVFLLVSIPPLAAALVVGLIIAILQAATQIQDQTLPQVFKLFAAFGVLILLAPLLIGSVVDLGTRVFTDFPMLVP